MLLRKKDIEVKPESFRAELFPSNTVLWRPSDPKIAYEDQSTASSTWRCSPQSHRELLSPSPPRVPGLPKLNIFAVLSSERPKNSSRSFQNWSSVFSSLLSDRFLPCLLVLLLLISGNVYPSHGPTLPVLRECRQCGLEGQVRAMLSLLQMGTFKVHLPLFLKFQLPFQFGTLAAIIPVASRLPLWVSSPPSLCLLLRCPTLIPPLITTHSSANAALTFFLAYRPPTLLLPCN